MSDYDKSHGVLAMLRTSISGTKVGHVCQNCQEQPSRCHCETPDFKLVEFPKMVKRQFSAPVSTSPTVGSGK